jgi:exodeoxyribonuclease V alpha subunit
MADAIVTLRKNYRFNENSGIGKVSRAINKGDIDRTLSLFSAPHSADCSWWIPPTYDALVERLRTLIGEAMRDYNKATDPLEALALIGKLKILCAVRNGPLGVTALNRKIEEILAESGLITPTQDSFYRGKPVMVTRNDYSVDLYNGDIGVIMADVNDGGALKAFFPDSKKNVKAVFPHRLPPHETAYAMTVHKAQGSEFERVVLILPAQPSPVVTRELLYTAVTRSRTRFELWSTEEILRAGVTTHTKRISGLRDALWGEKKGEG